MKTLSENLKDQTQDLKNLYIKMTAEYTANQFDGVTARKKWNEVDWCAYFGLTPEKANEGFPQEFLTFPKSFYRSQNYQRYRTICILIDDMLKLGKDGYITKQILKAEKHYNQSIEKLADRIIKKGLNENNITLQSSRVGVNFETTATDGNMTVKAWTIVASGDVQAPHYRYLVK